MIIVSGCNKKSSGVTPVTTGLSFTAQISLNNVESEYRVIASREGNIEIQTLKPESLADLCFNFSGSAVTVSYKGLEYKTELSSLPESSCPGFLYTVLSSLSQNCPTAVLKDEQYCISDSVGKYNYTLFLGEAGLPIKITESKIGFTAVIKNATILSD